jgi:hypothetical protein
MRAETYSPTLQPYSTALQRLAALSLEATGQLIKEQDFFVYRLTRANETKKYQRALIWGVTQEELQLASTYRT